jgi:erythronate-4-phosphate dehydrogenase
LCDPPLRDATEDPQYQSLDETLGADILSLHVPLSFEGPYPTWHMFDRNTLDRLSPRQFLINSARGAAIDNRELKSALQEGRIAGAVLDVWEGEPRIDYSLLRLVDIGTPHIAGTTLDGKIRATEMACEQLCRFYGIQSSWNADSFYPEPRQISPEPGTSDQDAVLSVLLQIFGIAKNDADLRMLGLYGEDQAAARFDQLRSIHPLRPEFRHFVVDLAGRHADLADTFTALGFKLRA